MSLGIGQDEAGENIWKTRGNVSRWEMIKYST